MDFKANQKRQGKTLHTHQRENSPRNIVFLNIDALIKKQQNNKKSKQTKPYKQKNPTTTF